MASTRIRGEEDARRLLTAKALRVTTQRVAIVRELALLRTPISHPELTERMAGQPRAPSGTRGASLDRATIYRNLLTLTDAGVLVRTQLGDGVWRYELPQGRAPEHGAHAHFVCTDCGDIACLAAGSVTVQGEATRNQIAEVQLRGRCVGCCEA